MIRTAAVIFASLMAVTAFAQSTIIDLDDFLDPRATGGRPVFLSCLVVGGASNMNDAFSPLGKNFGFLHLANSFYWRSLQFDYKRSQMDAGDDQSAAVYRFTSVNATPIVVAGGARFPSGVGPAQNATPKSKDALGAALYWPVGGGGIPVMLRTRLTVTRQPIETDLQFESAGNAGSRNVSTQRLFGGERTFALDTDTWLPIAGHDVYGSLAVSETKTTGTLADRKERALAYTSRFPSVSLNKFKILIRPTLTVGGISNRGGSAVNLFNPAVEIFRPFPRTGANLHVIYSPQWVAGGGHWSAAHQVAVLIDRALFVKVF